MEAAYILLGGLLAWGAYTLVLPRLVQLRPILLPTHGQEVLSPIETLQMGIIKLAPDGRILESNPYFQQLVGISPEEIQKRVLTSFLAPGESPLPLTETALTSPCQTDPSIFVKQFAGKEGRIFHGKVSLYLHEGLFHQEPQFLVTVEDISHLYQVEKALQLSEERLKVLMDDNLLGVLYTRLDTFMVLDANDTFLKMIGYSRQEMEAGNINWRTLTPPGFEALDTKAIQESLTLGKITPFEKQYYHKNGEIIDVLVSSVMTNMERHECIAIIVDITERKLSERTLLKSQEVYNFVQKATNDAIWDWNCIDNTVVLNQGIQDQFLYPLKETYELDWWSSKVHPEDLDRVLKSIKTNFEAGERYWSNRYRFKKYNGEYAIVMDRGYVLYNEAGQAIRMIGSMMDITAQENAQRHLRQTLMRERLVRQIIEFTSQTFDLEQITQYTMKQLTEFTQAERCTINRFLLNPEDSGQTFTPVLFGQYTANSDIPPIYSSSAYKSLAANYNTIPKYPTPLLLDIYDAQECDALLEQMLRQYGSSTPKKAVSCIKNQFDQNMIRSLLVAEISYRGIPFGCLALHQCTELRRWSDEDKRLLETIATHLGIVFYQTELYQQEKHSRALAEAANQNKSYFLANMSHELRTPLNVIIGFTEMLANEKQLLAEKSHRFLDIISTNGRHLLKLVNDLMDISRIEVGQLQLEITHVNVKELVTQVEDLMSPMAQDKNITLSVHISEEIRSVEADPARVKQILINLIHNAIKFNHPNGWVNVRVYLDGSWLALDVEDNGIGMDIQELSALFTAFYQCENTLDKRFDGCGLGLTLTKQLVELHKGFISVKSELNVGSTFNVKIPQRPLKADEVNEGDLAAC